MTTQEQTVTLSEKLESAPKKFDDKFASLFDQLISNNFMTEDVIVDGVKFTLKTLSSQEYLDSDTIYMATLSGLPADVIGRARMISNLAYSVTAINDVPVVESDRYKREERQKLYEHLYKLPPWIIDKLNKVFMKIMRIQYDTTTELYSSPAKAAEQIENF